MNKYFICCEKCFELIGKRNTRAARLWMDLCALRLEKGEILTLQTIDFPELRVLETLGFLVSTEDGFLKMTIKVKGHLETTVGEHFFCIEGGQHD